MKFQIKIKNKPNKLNKKYNVSIPNIKIWRLKVYNIYLCHFIQINEQFCIIVYGIINTDFLLLPISDFVWKFPCTI